MNYLDRSQITGTYVRLPDGRVIEVEVDEEGRITPIREEAATPPKPRPDLSVKPGGRPGMMDLGDLTAKVKAGAIAGYVKQEIEQMMKMMKDPEIRATNNDLDPETLLDSAFKAQLKSVMTDNKYDRVVHGRTRGKLDMTRLFKAKTGATSIFTQKQARKGKRYNIVLVLDESGSMSHREGGITRIEQAAAATLAIAKNLEGYVNLAIIGFNHYIVVHKAFDQPIDDYADMFQQMAKRALALEGRGCNHDYDALAQAYEMLKGQEGENLVLFLSDGEPVTCGNDDGLYVKSTLKGNQKDQKKNLHHLVEANKPLAATIGLGIECQSWQVPDNISAGTLSELKPKIIDIIRRKVKRG